MVKHLARSHIVLPIIATIFLVLAITLTFTWFGFAHVETKNLKIANVTLNLQFEGDLTNKQVKDQIIDKVEFSKSNISLNCYVRGKLNFYSTNSTLTEAEKDYLLALNYNSFTPYTDAYYGWVKYYDYYYLVDGEGNLLELTDTSTSYLLAKEVKFNGVLGSYFESKNSPTNLKLSVLVEAIQSINLPSTKISDVKGYFDETFETSTTAGYIVEYNRNADNASTTVATTIYEQGKTLPRPQDPTRPGYTFGGWYTDASCSDDKKYSFTDIVDDSFTLYAKWIQN